ncbi:hypothetical protein BJX68DRAFT_245711 [Aspergillus pseudodeflectus]|uniref:Uncharacterized protein n=1 Tax=Aspergillus pseudodeflectus TaxID=176178 RepID=A0ABR4JMT0_9EURO
MRSAVPRKPVPIQQIRPGTANSLKSEGGHSLRRKPASSDLRHSDLQTVQARVQRVPERPSMHLASALASGSSHAPVEFEASSFSARVGSRPGTENPRNLSAEFWNRRAGPRIPSSPLAPLADSVKGAVPEGRQRVSRSRAQSQASSSRGPYMPAASTSARCYESSNSSADSLYNETQAQTEWELVEMGAHEVLTSLPVQRL